MSQSKVNASKFIGLGLAGMGVLVLALFLGSGVEDDEILERARAAATAERLSPAGSVRLAGSEAAAQAAAPAAADAKPKSPKELVDGACAACHVAGVAGAPKIGDAAEWGKRAEAGMDTLIGSVINGKGAMPPRGGSQYSDEEIRLAVEYLVSGE